MRDGWQAVRLGDIARVARGISWSSEQERLEPGDDTVPVVRIGNVQPDRIDMRDRLHLASVAPLDRREKSIRPTTVLVVGSNGNPDRIGNCHLATPAVIGLVYASFLIGIDADDPLLAAYLGRWLQSPLLQGQITAATSGSTGLKNIGLAWLRDLRVDLPPVAEQRRIVDLLDAIDHVQTQAWLLAESALHATRLLLDDVLRSMPESRRLGDLAIVRGGKRLPKGTPWPDHPTAHPYIRVVDMHRGRINDSSLVHVPDKVWQRIRRYTVEPDDILISIVGTIGEIATVPRALGGANLTENAALVRPGPDLDPHFLAAFLRSEAGQSEIARLTVGTTQPKLALFRIEEIRLPFGPIQEQRGLAAGYSALDDVATAAADESLAARRLREAIADALVTGTRRLGESYDRFLDTAS